MQSIIEKDNINTNRQFELDIARGLAVFFMVAIHTQDFFSNEIVRSSIFGSIVNFLGGPTAAPVFMFLLGVGIVYSKKSDAKTLLKRGILMLAAGYLLNILRGTIPSLIGYLVTKDNTLLSSSIIHIFEIDILQFAGLSLLFFAFVVKKKFNNISLIIIGFLLIGLNMIIINVNTDNIYLSAVIGLFWGSSELSYFPFLSWIIYPILGYVFGTMLIKCNNKKRLYSFLLLASMILLISIIVITYKLRIDIGFYDPYKYYHHSFFGNLIFVFFTTFWISILYFISKVFFGLLKTTISRWSKNVTSIYFIHWVIIGLLSLFIEQNSNGFLISISIFLTLMISSDLLSILYLKRIFKKKKEKVLL